MKNLFDATRFHRLALIHHQYPIGNLCHHAHIVSDKDNAHRHLFLQYFD